MVYFTCYQINIQVWVKRDPFNEVVITFSQLIKIIPNFTNTYELWIINIALCAEFLLQLHVKSTIIS